MPVVLTTAPGLRRSGHVYDDRTGISYEFPAGRYERWIVPGERFLYCEPKRGYFGCGLVGQVTTSSNTSRRVADILSFEPFAEHVGLRESGGGYFEQDTQFWKGSVYWAQGVRPISDATLEAILAAAEAAGPPRPNAAAARRPRATGGYASAKVAQEVEQYSVRHVVEGLRTEFPDLDVQEMPRSNPGFDIRVGPVSDPVLFVEVKGTQSADPVFFMSEGEREFSCRHGDRYRLHVVVGIDLKSASHVGVHVRPGAIQAHECELKTTQWRGKVSP